MSKWDDLGGKKPYFLETSSSTIKNECLEFPKLMLGVRGCIPFNWGVYGVYIKNKNFSIPRFDQCAKYLDRL